MADRLKNVQISEELFFALLKYHLVEMDEVLPQIKKGLEEKLEAMVRRELYIKYKTAPTEEEREKARQEYLNKVADNTSCVNCTHCHEKHNQTSPNGI